MTLPEFALVAAALHAAFGSGQSNTTSKAAVEVEALEHAVEKAYLDADAEFLASTLRDDFVFTHGTGNVAGKTETLD